MAQPTNDDHGMHRGQALTEFALVFPIFALVLFGVIVFGLGVFYQQQLANAAREAARYAATHSATALRPTVSWLDPIDSMKPGTYNRWDRPEDGWPYMTAAARGAVWALDPSSVSLSACWSGYVDTSVVAAGVPDAPASPPNEVRDCRINGVNPLTQQSALACPAPMTIPDDPATPGLQGDDTASDMASSNYSGVNRVTVYVCYPWTPPLSGFLMIPTQIMMRAVVTEVVQQQQ